MNGNKWGDRAQLRMAAESLADAINMRTRVHNRVRSGSADPVLGQPTEKQIASHPLGEASLVFENTLRDGLRRTYELEVPQVIQEWAAEIPILKSGELFPRIVGLTGNPRHAIPLKMEGEGAARTAVPDGDPYERSLRQFWQWCGRGDPDIIPEKGNQALLLKMGKATTISPLLFTFSKQLVMSVARSQDSRDSQFYKAFLEARRDASGHDGPCGQGYPACGKTHKRHFEGHLRSAEETEQGLPQVTDPDERERKIKVIARLRGRAENGVCRNRKIPPMSPNGCGTVAHPEWGAPGSPWRPGHVNMHAHRAVQKELLRQFWIVAEQTEW